MSKLRFNVEVDTRIQLATQHLGRQVIQRLDLIHDGEEPLRDLELRISMDPDFAVPLTIKIAGIAEASAYSVPLDQLKIALKAERLANLSERQPGHILIQCFCGQELLASQAVSVEFAAHNEWLGNQAPPEMLAAFVTPNHPAMATVLDQVRRTLEAQGHSGSLEGYQGHDPQRVMVLASAVYQSIQGLKIGYINPPASFEKSGQKIRGVEQVLGEKQGTCLDLTVLMVGALEQIGLNPIIVMQDGHAYPGVWLTDWHLPNPWTDDPLPLRKRVTLSECLVFDSSAATQGMPFKEACAKGFEGLNDVANFRFGLDIMGARIEGVTPLGLLRLGSYVPVSAGPASQDTSLPTIHARSDNDAAETPDGRIERWKTKLLDLSLRNRLLNHKDGKSVMPLVGEAPGQIEDVLIKRGKLELRPRQTLEPTQDVAGIVDGMLGQGRVLVDLPNAEFDKRALELFRKNNQMRDESGTSALFLALGYLEWYESPSSAQPRLAPLLLVPLTMERTKVGGPYFIVRNDDDVMWNSSLFKKLETDFGIRGDALLQPPPSDESGVDVDGALRLVLEAVKDEPRFDVKWRAEVAFYQFQKFMMWLDLEQNAEALLSSDVVRHLIEGSTEVFPNAGKLPEPSAVDRRPANQDLSVVDADSSQLAAVFGALEGNSFVLQGPPGTGKSQTITNLIAQAISLGKTVLFVSEKRAALEVVQTRLKNVGLGPFTLEMHSDKCSKTQVVRQLEEPFKFKWEEQNADWEDVTKRLGDLKEKLNSHTKKMHESGPFGESLYQVVSRLIHLDALATPRIAIKMASFPNAGTYRKTQETIANLAIMTERIGTPSAHTWSLVIQPEWSVGWQANIADGLPEAIAFGQEWQRARDEAVALILGDRSSAPEVYERIGDAARALGSNPGVTLSLLSEPKASIEDLLERALALIGNHETAFGSMTRTFSPDLLSDIDVSAERLRFKKWAEAFFLFAFFMLFFARRHLAKYAVGALPDNKDISEALSSAQTTNETHTALTAIDTDMRRLFGPSWKLEETDTTLLQNTWTWASEFRSIMAGLREVDPETAKSVLELASDPERLDPSTRTGKALETFRLAAAQWNETRKQIEELISMNAVWASLNADQQIAQLQAFLSGIHSLRDWCDWLTASLAVDAAGLSELVSGLKDGSLNHSTLLGAYERALRENYWDMKSSQDHDLRQFRGYQHDRIIQRFAEIDTQAKGIARQEIQARLAARLPDFGAPGEMEILRKEFKKQRSHKSPRRLFAEVPNVLLRLKPCVLMSPLSVARFLDPRLSLFDLVIFDEASQIPPWDAIGAIARGKQAIIVGDSKQLPPTSFFASTDDEEDIDDDDVVELESILDQAVVRGVPQMTLNWHYRSRHETLIAFSNHHYYENRLHVFPSPHHDSPLLGLKWVEVKDGFYDRGGSRTNRAEALQVVNEIFRRLEDPDLSKKSIGIVTFSSAQQKAVEDLMDEERRKRPHLEKYFGPEVREPVFIKNLENVQGDERDIIFFSIGYGPDQTGRTTMAFGPLNRTGGERRLNVAITRARELLTVFSTLRPDQIDLSRTNAVGVRHLKTFLDYAARGHSAILEAVTLEDERGFGSPFEEEVHDALVAKGYEVHTQVGVGGFFIDLAVVDPNRPGAYMLGIECDGASYHSAKTARDRDRIRQTILEGLGWQIHRIWSTDWWTQRSSEVDRAVAVLVEAQNRQEKDALVSNLFQAIPDVLPPAAEVTDEVTRWPVNTLPWLPPTNFAEREQARFYDSVESATIMAQVEQVATQAAPMPVAAVAKHISKAWGFSSTTQKVVGRITDLANASKSVHVSGDVLWRTQEEQSRWKGFRHHELHSREIAEIPDAELAEAALWIVGRAVSISREELVAETARTFGFQRAGARIRENMDQVIDDLVGDHRLEEADGRLQISGEV